MALVDTLIKIGLSDKEAKVYLASLELGETTVQQVARKAGVSRPSTYLQITALIQKGLMSSTPRGKKKYFSAEPPERLRELLRNQERDIKAKEGGLDVMLPQLKELFSLAREQPNVRFYEGWEGLKSQREEFFKCKDKFVRNIVPLDELFEISPHHQEEFTPRRVEMGIHSRVIYTHSKGSYFKQSDPKLLREARFVPRDKFPFSGDMSICGDTVTLSSLKGKYLGVLIKSKEISDVLRALFDLAWEEAKQYQADSAQKEYQ